MLWRGFGAVIYRDCADEEACEEALIVKTELKRYFRQHFGFQRRVSSVRELRNSEKKRRLGLGENQFDPRIIDNKTEVEEVGQRDTGREAALSHNMHRQDLPKLAAHVRRPRFSRSFWALHSALCASLATSE